VHRSRSEAGTVDGDDLERRQPSGERVRKTQMAASDQGTDGVWAPSKASGAGLLPARDQLDDPRSTMRRRPGILVDIHSVPPEI
jgi:hypothetical protein